MINEQWLHTFKTLVELKHFTKTAEFLNMTQPGVSQHIKKLEESFGYLLISRIGKSFELTREGRIVYEYSLKKYEDEICLFESLSSENENEGEIKIACSGTLAMILYPSFLERQKKYPGLKIYLEAAPNYLIEKKVINNEVDLGITTSQSSLGSISEREIGKEELNIVYPKKAKKLKSFFSEGFGEIGFVDHPDGQGYLMRVLKSNLSKGHDIDKINFVSYVNQINQILTPVSMGLGFTVLPKRFIKNFSKGLNVSILENKKPVYDNYFLIQKKNKSLGKKYRWFINCLEDILKS